MDLTYPIMIGGGVTLISLILTALAGLRIIKIGLKGHKKLAFITIVFAILHGAFAFLYFMGFISF